MHILLVEDDKTSRDLLNLVLQAEGHTVEMAVDGEEAWSLLAKDKGEFDVCMLDLSLPGMSGFDLLERMRAEETHKRTPVILCTALKDRDTVRRAAGLGVAHFIGKPYSRTMMRDKLQQVSAGIIKVRPIEDSAKVCERLGIDQNIYRQMVQSLLTDAEETVTILRNPMDAAGAKAVLIRIPGVSGSCLNFGLSALSERFLALKKTLDDRGAGASAQAASADAQVLACLDEIGIQIKRVAERLTPAA
jgi:two-component system chemotaxis response regulator CheY